MADSVLSNWIALLATFYSEYIANISYLAVRKWARGALKTAMDQVIFGDSVTEGEPTSGETTATLNDLSRSVILLAEKALRAAVLANRNAQGAVSSVVEVAGVDPITAQRLYEFFQRNGSLVTAAGVYTDALVIVSEALDACRDLIKAGRTTTQIATDLGVATWVIDSLKLTGTSTRMVGGYDPIFDPANHHVIGVKETVFRDIFNRKMIVGRPTIIAMENELGYITYYAVTWIGIELNIWSTLRRAVSWLKGEQVFTKERVQGLDSTMLTVKISNFSLLPEMIAELKDQSKDLFDLGDTKLRLDGANNSGIVPQG